MGEPTLDRRFHRKLETEGLTPKKVLILVVLALGVACSVGVVDQLQRFGAQSDNSPPPPVPSPDTTQGIGQKCSTLEPTGNTSRRP
jgi:hypothetical protein